MVSSVSMSFILHFLHSKNCKRCPHVHIFLHSLKYWSKVVVASSQKDIYLGSSMKYWFHLMFFQWKYIQTNSWWPMPQNSNYFTAVNNIPGVGHGDDIVLTFASIPNANLTEDDVKVKDTFLDLLVSFAENKWEMFKITHIDVK